MTREQSDADFLRKMELRPKGLFSMSYDLLVDDEVVGVARHRLWGGVDVTLSHDELELRHRGLFRRTYELTLKNSGQLLAVARPIGFWQRHHEIEIAAVSGSLEHSSMFSSRRDYVVAGKVMAFVTARSLFSRGVIVRARAEVSEPEMLFVGLVAQLIRHQQQQAAAS